MSKTRSSMTDEEISRYIDWCREFGVDEAQRMLREIEKNKKRIKKQLEKK